MKLFSLQQRVHSAVYQQNVVDRRNKFNQSKQFDSFQVL